MSSYAYPHTCREQTDVESTSTAVPLTDKIIPEITPNSRPRKLYDSGGLYLLLHPNGSRYWRFKYRFARKEKLAALGVYPEVSIAEARERRDAARAFLRQGIDPVLAHREASREHVKVAALGAGLRLSHANDGRLTIETPSITVRLTKSQTDALRAFLLANP